MAGSGLGQSVPFRNFATGRARCDRSFESKVVTDERDIFPRMSETTHVKVPATFLGASGEFQIVADMGGCSPPLLTLRRKSCGGWSRYRRHSRLQSAELYESRDGISTA